MSDQAELSLLVDARSVGDASRGLQGLTQAAGQAEAASYRLADASRLSGSALLGAASAARAMRVDNLLAAEDAARRLGTAMGQVGADGASGRLRTLSDVLGTTAGGLDRGATSLRGLGRGLREAVPFAGELSNRLTALTAGAVGLGILTGQLRDAASSALEFSTNIAKVSTVLPDDQQGAMPMLTESVKALAVQYGRPAQDQAQALYDIIAAGAQDAAVATDILATSNKLAVGGITSVGKAADGLTSVMANWGSSLSSATEAADAMFIAAAAGKTSIEQIARHVAVVAPMAAQMGVSFDELMAATGALTKGGMRTEMAMHGLRAVLGAVSKPSKQAADLARILGIEYSVAGLKARGLAGFLEHLREKTGGSIEDMAVLMNGVEALTPVMALNGAASQSFADTLAQMGDKAGATERAFAKMAATPQFQLDLLKAKFDELKLSAGESLLEGLAGPVKFLNENFEQTVGVVGRVAQIFGMLVAMRTGGWIQQWVSGFIAQNAAATKARDALTANIVANAGYQRQAGQTSVSALQGALAMLRQRDAALQLALTLEGPLAGGYTTTAIAANRAAINQAQAALAAQSATGASKAFGSAVAFAGGPVGILIGALGGLYMVYQHYAEQTERADEAQRKWLESVGYSAKNAHDLIGQMRAHQSVLDDSKRSTAEHAKATGDMEVTRTRLLALGPEYRAALGAEAKSWHDIAAAVDRVNQASLVKLNAEIASIQAKLNDPDLGKGWTTLDDRLGDAWAKRMLSGTQQEKRLAEQRAARDEAAKPVQEALNKLLEQKAELMSAMAPIEERQVAAVAAAVTATGEHGKSLIGSTKAADLAAAALERFVSGLEEQARMAGKARGDSIKEKDEYALLNEELRARADAAIVIIEKAKAEEEAQKKAAAAAKQYAEQVNSLNMALGIEGEDKFARATELLNSELERGNITLDQYNERIAKAADLWTEEGRARVKHQQELDQYLKRADPQEEAIRKLGLLNELYAEGSIGVKAYAEEAGQLYRRINPAFDLMAEGAEKAAKHISDAIVEFASTGEFAVKDMVEAIIRDISRLLAEKAVTYFINWIANAAIGGMAPAAPAVTPVAGKAGGGSAHAMKPLLVGERGPELFVPRGNGTIVPSASGGGGPISIKVEVNVAADGSASAAAVGAQDVKGETLRHSRALGTAIVKKIQEELLPGGSLYHLKRA